jgi:hypothetical protein
MQDLAIFGQRDGASGINGPPDVFFFDIPRPGSQGYPSAAIHTSDVIARNPHYGEFHGHVGDALGFLESAANGAYCGVQIDDQALSRPLGFGRAHSEKSRASVFDIRYQRTRLGAADIQRGEIAFFLAH